MTNEFSELNLHPQLVEAVLELGYANPTPIQAAVIPTMLQGQDIIGQAQTGTGKTAAFSLPLLHNITPGAGHVQALVVSPTRELALQVAQAIYQFGKLRGVRVLSIYGGQPYDRQLRRLKNGVDVVVGTPGRLLDLIKRGALDLSQLQTAVLDEADEMLSMGFIEDIEAILAAMPPSRQTALFSATLPREIRQLADRYLTDPKAITIDAEQRTVAAIEQRYYLVNEEDKTAVLTRLFEVEEIESALIFTRTRAGTGELANELTQRGFPAESLNGDLSQDAREQVVGRFREGKIKVLVATDIAARGLDIDHISHVFNFDIPQFPDAFVHRVGRTGRAGKTGVAITLVTPKERGRLRRIEGYIKQKLNQAEIPTAEAIKAFREAQLLEQLLVWLRRGRCKAERETVAQLVQEGFDPIEVAAAALKLARAEEKQRPIAPISEVVVNQPRERRTERSSNGRTNGRGQGRPQREKSHEVGMVRLLLSAGKEQGVRVNDVVGRIAFHANIPGRSLGAIRINKDNTLVDVPTEFAGKVLAASGALEIHRQAIEIEKA